MHLIDVWPAMRGRNFGRGGRCSSAARYLSLDRSAIKIAGRRAKKGGQAPPLALSAAHGLHMASSRLGSPTTTTSHRLAMSSWASAESPTVDAGGGVGEDPAWVSARWKGFFWCSVTCGRLWTLLHRRSGGDRHTTCRLTIAKKETNTANSGFLVLETARMGLILAAGLIYMTCVACATCGRWLGLLPHRAALSMYSTE